MTGLRAHAAAIILLLVGGPAHAESVTVTVDYQDRQIELAGDFEKPAGPGSFPAVVLLHGCSGNNEYSRDRSEAWGDLLHQQGYATLIIDSFTARGYSNVCNNATLMPYRERAKDVLAAAYVLAGLSDVRADRIAAVGFSHGGGTVLDAAVNYDELKPWRERLASRGKLVAEIGFYPGCRETMAQDFVLPVLILVGDADDWTPARYCTGRTGGVAPGVPPLRLKVYPGAFHDFDVDKPERLSNGHKLGYNEAAAADARNEVTAFLRQYLQ